MTLAPQGLRQAAAAADGHEGPAEELSRLPQAAQAVVATLHQGMMRTADNSGRF